MTHEQKLMVGALWSMMVIFQCWPHWFGGYSLGDISLPPTEIIIITYSRLKLWEPALLVYHVFYISCESLYKIDNSCR